VPRTGLVWPWWATTVDEEQARVWTSERPEARLEGFVLQVSNYMRAPDSAGDPRRRRGDVPRKDA
jgi:hypothetical protein